MKQAVNHAQTGRRVHVDRAAAVAAGAAHQRHAPQGERAAQVDPKVAAVGAARQQAGVQVAQRRAPATTLPHDAKRALHLRQDRRHRVHLGKRDVGGDVDGRNISRIYSGGKPSLRRDTYAFIKSVRGSDPNAAVYWLARMIEGGEDPSFIARRLLILASEDIGNANPTGLMMANNCFQAVNVIGYPEARIILAQCTTYLACSPKSNASYKAINEAQQAVKHNSNYAVPLALRNAPTTLMEEIGYGQEYKYPHQVPGAFIPQEYLPEQLKGTVFYQPGKNPREEETRKLLRHLWGQKYGY